MEYREVTIEDAKAVLRYKEQIFDESEFLSKTSNDYDASIDDEAAGIIKALHATNTLTWLAVENDEIVGLLNIRPYEASRHKDNATLGITVKKAYWSKGIGRRLMNKAIEFFDESSLHRLEIMVVKDNERAVHLYRSLGFEEEGTLKEFHRIDDKYYDVLVMAIVKNDKWKVRYNL